MPASRMLALAIAIAALTATAGGRPEVPDAATLPSQLTDREFWDLTASLSEPDGKFGSDNLVSNELGYQKIFPAFAERHPPGGVYLGVGPEQNFTYIANLAPRVAFIVDIRRANRDLHLLYRALFELARNRIEFVSLLFSLRVPPDLASNASAAEIFAAFDRVTGLEADYHANRGRVIALLTESRRWPLSAAEIRGVEYTYGKFFRFGPRIAYDSAVNLSGDMLLHMRLGSYTHLMRATDALDEPRSFLSSEARFKVVKDLQLRNLVVPVVGNFAGLKALRAVGEWLRARRATVSAFYTSNVQDYLRQDGIWDNFCRNVATMPIDRASEFIWSGAGPDATTLSSSSPIVGLSRASSISDVTRPCRTKDPKDTKR